MVVVMLSISHSTVDCYMFYTEFEPDKDLCSQNVVQLKSTVLREMLNIMIYCHMLACKGRTTDERSADELK